LVLFVMYITIISFKNQYKIPQGSSSVILIYEALMDTA